MDNTTVDKMVSWVETSEPALIAKGSEKFEQGKARGIYGTSTVDYTIMIYVIGDKEKHLYLISCVECGLSGTSETSTVLRRHALMKQSKVMYTMLDYSNFNIPHTLEAQAAVFKALLTLDKTITVPDEQPKAIKWCRKASLNQSARSRKKTQDVG